MKWFFIYQYRPNLHQIDPDILVKGFDSRIDLLQWGAANLKFGRGLNSHAIIRGEEHERSVYDAHEEIDILVKKQSEKEHKEEKKEVKDVQTEQTPEK